MGDIVLCYIAVKRQNKGLINKVRSENQFGIIPLGIIQMHYSSNEFWYRKKPRNPSLHVRQSCIRVAGQQRTEFKS